MRTGTRLSALGHGVLIALAVFGLPWFGPAERDPVRVTEVSFVTEEEFAAAQAAAPAEAPRAEDAPAVLPAPRPAARPPEPAAAPAAEAPEQPEPQVAALEPPAEPDAPQEAPRIAPHIVKVAPPAAAVPPQPRSVPRVKPTPTPPPPEAVRPAETAKPVTAPAPAAVARVEEPPQAPPEAEPEPEAAPAPEAPLALETASRPKPRRGNVAPRDDAAAAVLAALQQRATPPTAATPPTPATAPTATPPSPAKPAAKVQATSLPVGPPLSNAEKDGLKLAVQRCWNVPAGLRDAQELKVTLAAELAADGEVINASIRLIDPSPAPDGRFQQAYEAGRRALIRCSPYADLPRDKFAQWRNIEVVFNPEGMVSW